MSFRTRLSLFFLLIVLVPMVSLTIVLFRLIADSENGKADANLAARQQAVVGLVEQARAAAAEGARAAARDLPLATALERGRGDAADRRADRLLRLLDLKRIVIDPPQGPTVVDAGGRTAIFPVRRRLQSASGRPFGVLEVFAAGPVAFVREVRQVAGLRVVVRRDGRVVAASSPAVASLALPEGSGDVELDGTTLRVASFRVPDRPGSQTVVSLLAPRASARDIGRSRRVAGAVIFGFLALAVAFAILVSRSLQRQIGRFLEAARRITSGDYTARVPTAGGDEFAELGQQFNHMSAELDRREQELAHEQARHAEALRRIGDTFASSLDADAVLAIVLDTVVQGTGATGGRAGLRRVPSGPVSKVITNGEVSGLEEALWAAEAEALDGTPATETRGGANALAFPLEVVEDEDWVIGAVSAARPDRPFTESERDLVGYLARQASVSLQNVVLYEATERDAATDELTGLANRRQFRETLAGEIGRAHRFNVPVGVVMMDIDDFKQVNDTRGHLVGDRVLREVGRVLRDCSREVDTPARYGGEEFVMVLPGADLEGAYQLAERIRLAIEAREVTVPGGDSLRVTASLGAATAAGRDADARELIRRADGALYAAKAGGKNQTVRATSRTRA